MRPSVPRVRLALMLLDTQRALLRGVVAMQLHLAVQNVLPQRHLLQVSET
jgi:hypothetical protein